MNYLKNYWVAGVVLLVVAIGAIAYVSKHGKKEITPISTKSQQQTEKTTPQSMATPPPVAKPPVAKGQSTWQGQLKPSNNLAKGNLMLVTKDRTLYLHTSRDFTTLLGKQVNVAYQGTLDNFTLGGITAQ